MNLVTRFTSALVGVFCLAVASGASAQIEAETFSINPHAGIHLFEDDQNLDDSGVYGVGLGYALTEHWGLEGIFDYSNPDFDAGGGDVDVFRYGLDALYHFRPEKKLIPYLAAGGGAMTFDPSSGSSDTDAQANAGGGVKYFFTRSLALRADARYLVSFEDTAHNFLGTLGLTYVLGSGSDRGKAKPEPARAHEPAPAAVATDSDGDGVNDDRDRCQSTPRGVETDANGCAIRMDSDGDGVEDAADACAGTAGGVAVDDKGCPRDSDGDGTADANDQCADTPQGAKVDARGCWVLDHVRFESGKAALQPVSTETLNEALAVLQQNSALRVEVQGHSDNTGSAAFNRTLSEQRAKAVVGFFVGRGVAAKRLTHNGFGPANPIASNDTAEGRAQNRRVELKPLP